MSGEVPDPIDPNDLTFALQTGSAVYRKNEIPLPPKPLQILQFIHSKHPQPVSINQLLKGVWNESKTNRNLPERTITTLNQKLAGFGFHVAIPVKNHGYQILQGDRAFSGRTRYREMTERPGNHACIQVFEDWRQAYPIISRVQHSLVIIDSYFGHSGEIEPLIKDALKNVKNRIDVLIYLASPLKDFGAQRFKEKERPRGVGLNYKQLLIGSDRKRDRELLKHYRREYQKRYDSDVSEIKGHFTKPGIRFRIYTYPTMPATRVYIVDDTHYIFGRYPLLGHNPGHPCFHATRDKDLSGALAEAVNGLADQVKIIRRISSRVWPPIRSKANPKRKKLRTRR